MRFDAAKGGERDGAEGNDQGRLHGVESLAEPVAAGSEFRLRGRPVSALSVDWQAEGRVRDEDIFAGEPGFGGVAGKRYAGPARAEAPRGFADEEDCCVRGPVARADDRTAREHAWTSAACGGGAGQDVESHDAERASRTAARLRGATVR